MQVVQVFIFTRHHVFKRIELTLNLLLSVLLFPLTLDFLLVHLLVQQFDLLVILLFLGLFLGDELLELCVGQPLLVFEDFLEFLLVLTVFQLDTLQLALVILPSLSQLLAESSLFGLQLAYKLLQGVKLLWFARYPRRMFQQDQTRRSPQMRDERCCMLLAFLPSLS